jgi:hypothetical protein
MPHLVLAGEIDLARAVEALPREVHRWGRAVLKVEECWLRADRRAALVAGVVVELARPLHPVAVVASHHGDTHVRLWPRAAVERTEAVQRWLLVLARELQRLGAGAVTSSNLPPALWLDLGLEVAERE